MPALPGILRAVPHARRWRVFGGLWFGKGKPFASQAAERQVIDQQFDLRLEKHGQKGGCTPPGTKVLSLRPNFA